MAYFGTEGKSWLTRFGAFVNHLFNPEHAWFDYSKAPESGGLESLYNRFTGAGLTGADLQANDLQMQNAHDIWQQNVTGMQDAGINPALMYQHGSSPSAPSVAPSQASSMAELMQLFLLPKQKELLEAQVSNTQAETAKKTEETLSEVKNREKVSMQIDEIRQNIENRLSEKNLTDAQRERLQIDMSWIDRLNAAVVAEHEASAALSDAQKTRIEALLEGEKILQSKDIEDFAYRWRKIDAEISKLSGENAILKKDLENYALNHASNGFMGSGLSLQNLFRLGKESKTRPHAGEENKFGTGTDIRDLINSGQ